MSDNTVEGLMAKIRTCADLYASGFPDEAGVLLKEIRTALESLAAQAPSSTPGAVNPFTDKERLARSNAVLKAAENYAEAKQLQRNLHGAHEMLVRACFNWAGTPGADEAAAWRKQIGE